MMEGFDDLQFFVDGELHVDAWYVWQQYCGLSRQATSI